MSNFADIAAICSELEVNPLRYISNDHVSNLFWQLSERLEGQETTSERQQAQWEAHTWAFRLRQNKLIPKTSGPDANGEERGYPSLSLFDAAAYAYIESRLCSSKHPLLRARYAHFLWRSRKKHVSLAQQAVEAYVDLAMICWEELKISKERHLGIALVHSMENAWALSREVNYRRPEVISCCLEAVLHLPDDCSSLYYVRSNLINLLLSQPGLSSDDLERVAEACWQTAEALTTSGHTLGRITMLEL